MAQTTQETLTSIRNITIFKIKDVDDVDTIQERKVRNKALTHQERKALMESAEVTRFTISTYDFQSESFALLQEFFQGAAIIQQEPETLPLPETQSGMLCKCCTYI